MRVKKIESPFDEKALEDLSAGEEVLLTGRIYTARDQTHIRMLRLIEEGRILPFDFSGKVLYYCGPVLSDGRAIGSCGPTTSSRMDPFTPVLLDMGLKGMIGKGARSDKVVESIKKNKAVYFLAPAGCGAYLSEKVKKSEVVAFGDLGTEAIFELEVKDMPLVVGVDSKGREVFKK